MNLPYIFETGTCLVEWPDAAIGLLPLKFLTVTVTESCPEEVVSKITTHSGNNVRQALAVATCMDLDDQCGHMSQLPDETEDDYVRILELTACGDVWVDRLQLLRNVLEN